MVSQQETPAQKPANDPLDQRHDRNAFRLGWTPQAEIWNGRLAMIGFVAYLLWDLSGYSVVRDIFGLKR